MSLGAALPFCGLELGERFAVVDFAVVDFAVTVVRETVSTTWSAAAGNAVDIVSEAAVSALAWDAGRQPDDATAARTTADAQTARSITCSRPQPAELWDGMAGAAPTHQVSEKVRRSRLP